MKSKKSESKAAVIPKTIGHAFESFDFFVDAFNGTVIMGLSK